MKATLIGIFGLFIYIVFAVFSLFTDTTATNSGNEYEPLKMEAQIDSLNVPAGNYSEIYRPPVYIGISPGGPPNHIIQLKTGTYRRTTAGI